MSAKPSISAFVLVYNELGNFERTVAGLVSVLSGLCAEFEVIVVDDGSVDGSGPAADALAAEDPRVRVLHHGANRGYGAAVRSGIAACRLPLLFLIDGDGQFDPRELERLLPLIEGCDLVLGWRRARADGAHRRLFGACWNALTAAALGVHVKDVNCAFKLMRASTVKALPLSSDGALISAELLSRARRRGAVWKEAPVEHYPRLHGVPTGASPDIVLRAFWELARLLWSRGA